MTREQFKRQWRQFKGELKSRWGQFTDDDLTEIEGDYDKFLGSLQARYGAQTTHFAWRVSSMGPACW